MILVLITIALGTLIVIALISVLTGGNLQKTIDIDTITSTGNVNQTSMTFSFENLMSSFYIDNLQGAIILIIVLIGIVVLIGIRIFDSGLSDSTIKSLTIFIEYLGLWLIFSTISYPLIVSIEVIGGFLYLFLTILFVIGVFQKSQN